MRAAISRRSFGSGRSPPAAGRPDAYPSACSRASVSRSAFAEARRTGPALEPAVGRRDRVDLPREIRGARRLLRGEIPRLTRIAFQVVQLGLRRRDVFPVRRLGSCAADSSRNPAAARTIRRRAAGVRSGRRSDRALPCVDRFGSTPARPRRTAASPARDAIVGATSTSDTGVASCVARRQRRRRRQISGTRSVVS